LFRLFIYWLGDCRMAKNSLITLHVSQVTIIIKLNL